MVDHSLLPYIGNCSSYVACNGGKASYGTCYSGESFEVLCENNAADCKLVFDYRYQECDRIFNDDYKDFKCLPECENYKLSSFCYDKTCFKYVLCYYGIPVLRECHDGLQYNADTDRCDFPEFVDCVENECPDIINTSNIIYVPSKAQCNKYFICSDGMPWPQLCANGLVYSSEFKACVPAGDEDCQMTPQKRNIKPFSRTPPRRADIICPASGVHFFAHNTRVDAYYYCVDGNGITLDCTPGLWYDSKIRECREPKYIGQN